MCGHEITERDNGIKMRKACCRAENKGYSIGDCNDSANPRGPAFDDMLKFAKSERAWLHFFRQSWQIATTNGFNGKLTELFAGESHIPEFEWLESEESEFDRLRRITEGALATKDEDYQKKLDKYNAWKEKQKKREAWRAGAEGRAAAAAAKAKKKAEWEAGKAERERKKAEWKAKKAARRAAYEAKRKAKAERKAAREAAKAAKDAKWAKIHAERAAAKAAREAAALAAADASNAADAAVDASNTADASNAADAADDAADADEE